MSQPASPDAMDASEVAQLVEVCRGKVRIYNQREVEFLQTVGGARTPTVAQARWLRDLAAREELNFAKINSAALAVLHAICRRWLPDGCLYGKEWVARNPTRADGKPGSFRINVNSGKWADFAQPDARGGDPISLAAYLFHDGDQVAAATDVKRMVGL